jgi:hypothetical protein
LVLDRDADGSNSGDVGLGGEHQAFLFQGSMGWVVELDGAVIAVANT